MDSYQDRDLERLRRKWLNALTKRQEYLDQQLQKLVSKHDKTEDDADREAQLLEMRLTLTEERNAVMVPSAGSGIPGAPAEWTPVPGMETHIPVIFLDLNADDFSSQDNLDDPEAGGWDATLTGEEEDEFFELQIVKQHDGEVRAEASWDSAVHSCPQLSKGTPADERVYLIVRVTVQLSHPADMQLVLRKRICVHVHGRQGFAQSLLKKMSHRSSIPGCGVTFEIVSNIPEDAQGVEERETLARMAANVENTASADSEAYIEKYLRSVLAVENLLTLDRLRQEVTVKEQLTGKGKLSRRSISSPNVNRLSGSRQDLIPFYSLGSNKGRWESQQDVSQTAVSRGIAPVAPSLPNCPPNNHPPDPGLSSLAASYLNPVKSFVPQMPKLLKSLFPVRDEKRGKQPSPLAHQPVPRIMVQCALADAGTTGALEAPSVAPAVTVPLAPVKLHDRPTKAPTPQAPEVQEGPPSPLSEASSGYFSHSVSSATLSDAFTLGLDGAAAASGQTPGSPPLTLFQATPETELPLPPVAPAADSDLPARPLSRSCLLSPVPAKQDAWSDSNASCDTKEPVFSEKEEAGAPPTPLPTCTPQKESCSRQSGGEVSPATERLGRPEDREKPASGSELDISKPQVPPDLLSLSPAPASPFRIQKVRTSELKSFTRMLGGDPSCSSAAEEDLLASGALGDGGARAPALGKLEVSSDSEEASEVPEWLKEGEYVTVGTNKMGIVRYIGPTDFQEGTWVGVELDLPSGKNDGSIGGKQYFKCNPGYGLLVRPGRVRRAAGAGRRRSAGLRLQGAPEPRRSSTLTGSATNLASLTAALAKAEGAMALRADRSQKNPENRKSWAS